MAVDSGCIKQVENIHGISGELFQNELYPKRVPMVLRGFDLGPCTDKWTVEYLTSQAGDKNVTVHVSENPQMDFLNKNFLYRTLPFSELVKRASQDINENYFICPEEKYYLRSLGDDPRSSIANITEQFPQLAQDLNIPDVFPSQSFFSSVFRIASRSTQLWTHYDVMDNILMQIKGRKRVVLFSPQDAHNLYLQDGKSTVLDIDHVNIDKFPLFPKVTRYECILEPGDVLFIPALWFHNVISEEFGIAVNVFWKHLDSSLYNAKDPYGNKDPLAVKSAEQIVDRAIKALGVLPAEYRDFYARLLVSRIERKCYVTQSHDHS
ncbi:tRNA wybutosine-synthesizing protein 5-like [Argonauta hians]